MLFDPETEEDEIELVPRTSSLQHLKLEDPKDENHHSETQGLISGEYLEVDY